MIVSFRTDEPHDERLAAKAAKTLQGLPGVRSVNLEGGRLVVVADNEYSLEDIVKALASTGLLSA